MDTPILRPFQPHDVTLCANRDGSQGVTLDMAIEQARHGPAFSAVYQGRIIGIAGVLLQWGGVGTTWMALADDMNGHGLWLTRTVKAVLDDVERAHRLHRLEAVALEGSDRNQRWLEGLGFAREANGTARLYTPQRQNMIRYERLKGA